MRAITRSLFKTPWWCSCGLRQIDSHSIFYPKLWILCIA